MTFLSLQHWRGCDQSPAHFVNSRVAMTNTSSALALIYPQRTILTCLGLALCLPLATKILTTWIMRPLPSRRKMSTHHVPQHAQSHMVSVLNSHLTSKPTYLIQLTLDTGAETSMIKSFLACSIGTPVTKSSHQALQAKG